MKPRFLLTGTLLVVIGCSRLAALTPAVLSDAEGKWKLHHPSSYRLLVEMSGDRVEAGKFEVAVQGRDVVSLHRNGLAIMPGRGEDYSMEGLFRMLEQELGLAEKPAMLGAPPGYSVYTRAKFDDSTGRLLRYRRTVGGTSNSIDVKVLEYEEK